MLTYAVSRCLSNFVDFASFKTLISEEMGRGDILLLQFNVKSKQTWFRFNKKCAFYFILNKVSTNT